MSLPNEKGLNAIQFYVTTKYSCGYIKNKSAQSLVAAPHKKIAAVAYNNLIKDGFRRSGQYVYKPRCENCQACIPIRLTAKNFTISRSQKRVKNSHSHIQVKILPLKFYEEHFQLYSEYQNNRHEANNQVEENITDYNDFLIKSNVESRLIEFKIDNKLVMVTIIDVMEEGISAVYTFYDCNYNKYSFGTYSILWLLDYWLINKIPH